MSGSNVRRKVRKRKSRAESSRMRAGVAAGLIGLAILLGFLTARFVIGPIIGYNSDESPIKQVQENPGEDSDEVKEEKESEGNKENEESMNTGANENVAETPEKGYALQFGAFSTKEAAEELVKSLNSKGIKTQVVEIDSIYKVISPVIKGKDQALEALNKIKDKEVDDVFVASFN